MFTLCLLEGGWHVSATKSRDLLGFCVGIAMFMYGVPMGPLEFTA
jgi:hypothetical protein